MKRLIWVWALLMAECRADWVKPLDNEEKLNELCTSTVTFQLMGNSQVQPPLLTNLFRSKILCVLPAKFPASHHEHGPLIWLMRSLGYCGIKRAQETAQQHGIEYSKTFQMDFLRAAFALLCNHPDEIGRFHLSHYAEMFRLIYESKNEDRASICNRMMSNFQDLYSRCHVESSIQGSAYGLDYFRNKCPENHQNQIIRPRSFFMRFARNCDTLEDLTDLNRESSLSLGKSLINDTVYLNTLSHPAKHGLSVFSRLPQVAMRTRLLLQHFPMMAIKLSWTLQFVQDCINETAGQLSAENQTDNTSSTASDPRCNADDMIFVEALVLDNKYIVENLHTLAAKARLGLHIELCLLCGVAVNTIFLALLLKETQKTLSTATILFIFNILFSNVLFIGSFVCLYMDLFDGELHFNEDSRFDGDASLDVAEMLQTHLMLPNQFLKYLVQETLYSLAQNGSLLGLTHLLVLVLVVITRSMAGTAIRLSRRCVVSVFALVWSFLVVTHVIFSALQFSAIDNLDHFFSRLKAIPSSLQCDGKPAQSDYVELGALCDRVAIFHTFGVYLLRGHTLFTITFLCTAVVVFLVTVFYHWRVRSTHEPILSMGLREHGPHRRRETLFNTLILSMGAFFISVSGQTIIEIAVFWVDSRQGIAHMATFYQWARIAAFVDPLINPILVAVRTPAIRRRLRLYVFLIQSTLCALCCPWRTIPPRKSSKHTSFTTFESRDRNGRKISRESRRSRSSEVSLNILCAKKFVRRSFLRRTRNIVRSHSIV